jgi:poly(3-hydroxybutyrate) depolymerase
MTRRGRSRIGAGISGLALPVSLSVAFSVGFAIVFAASPAAAEGSRGSGGATGMRKGWPCPGCVTVVPPGYSPDTPAPLFVALHGDEGSTRVVLRLWKAPLEKRGYILLALQCPKEKGCQGSFWRWAGDTSFMTAPLDAVEAAYNIDRERIYLSGWSGGSTYMGMSAPSISPRFAALNLNAGGIPPTDTSACAPCKAPVYYMMGGKNPFAHLAESARDYYKRCGHDVTWDFRKNLDHPGELGAISKEATKESILAWFDTKRNACAAAPGGGVAGADAGADAGAEAAPELSGSAKPITTPPHPAPAPSPGCGCGGASSAAAAGPTGALFLLPALVWRRRGRRGAGRG